MNRGARKCIEKGSNLRENETVEFWPCYIALASVHNSLDNYHYSGNISEYRGGNTRAKAATHPQ